MGVVYRATDLSLDRPAALKVIAPELAEDARFRTRFLKEPRLAASLDHPNVIPIYEAGEREGHLYLAMRYVEGSDLRTLLQRERKLAPERAMAILAQVAAALDAAHRRGLVHRDVKPANVLLDEDAHVYLTDFGITKQLGGASTDTGRVVGTLDYLAPEQIRGEAVDGRTDCYSLACVLYECLSGAPPFRRETEAETMWAHMQEQPAPLRGYPKLDPVLRKGLAKEGEDRHRSCAELIGAVAAALGLATPARATFAPPALVRRRRTARSRERPSGVAYQVADGPRQRRRRGGRRLGAERRGGQRLAPGPGDEESREDVQAGRPAERDRGRRGSGMGRERRRTRRDQRDRQRRADRSRLDQGDAHREAARR
jgi:serine/threonine protein kinase